MGLAYATLMTLHQFQDKLLGMVMAQDPSHVGFRCVTYVDVKLMNGLLNPTPTLTLQITLDGRLTYCHAMMLKCFMLCHGS